MGTPARDKPKRMVFTDEASFYTSGKVNHHNVRIWGSENPHAYHEHVCDSPKVNVWCCLMVDRVIGPFFFAKKTGKWNRVPGHATRVCCFTAGGQQPEIISQENGAPPH